MPHSDRKALIQKIEEKRKAKLITYLQKRPGAIGGHYPL
jgi:hypothetical protein